MAIKMKHPMEIFKMEKSDINDALDLVWEVFEEFEAPDYSDIGIDEFKSFINYSSVIGKFDKGELNFWGSRDSGGNLTGIIATRGESHICLLFVKKEYHRQGIARSLFEIIKEECSRCDMDRITVNSSPYAIEAYHRMGFVDTDSERTIKGIRFTPMVYKLK